MSASKNSNVAASNFKNDIKDIGSDFKNESQGQSENKQNKDSKIEVKGEKNEKDNQKGNNQEEQGENQQSTWTEAIVGAVGKVKDVLTTTTAPVLDRVKEWVPGMGETQENQEESQEGKKQEKEQDKGDQKKENDKEEIKYNDPRKVESNDRGNYRDKDMDKFDRITAKNSLSRNMEIKDVPIKEVSLDPKDSEF